MTPQQRSKTQILRVNEPDDARALIHHTPYERCCIIHRDRGKGCKEVFDGGLPYHSAFLRLARPATLAVRGRVLTVICLLAVSAFPSTTFLRVFPRFITKPFRGVGVGFEEPNLRLTF